MRILEIGDAPYFQAYLPSITDYFRIARHGVGPALEFRNLPALQAKVSRGEYDLISYHTCSKVVAPWHRSVSLPRRMVDTVTRSFSRSGRTNWYYFHYLIRKTLTPLIVIDTQDVPRINRSELIWLDHCRYWFMRELPPNNLNLFLNLDIRSSDVINIQRNPRIRANMPKIKPFALGYGHDDAIPPAGEKIHDVFYAGANHTTTVRQRGFEELRSLREAGLRVYIPETRLPKEEFMRACAQSWLVWSPEGQGWDCHRHYEALQMGSVPLINYPTIERLHPMRHGEHCLFYSPESGELTRAIRDALQDKERLRRIATDGLEHIRQHLTRSQLTRHILGLLGEGLLALAQPHFTDGVRPSPELAVAK